MNNDTTIRCATPDDALTIARIKSATWEQEPTDVQLIASALASSNHTAHIAYVNNEAAGFVDGFMTVSASGVARWEVDLLAILEAYRRRGLAPQLIEANLQSGQNHGARLARALVANGNLPAEKSFAACGFQPDEVVSELFIAFSNENGITNAGRISTHLVSVHTLSYRGIWIEETFTANDLSFAKATINRLRPYGWHIAGAVIPVTKAKAIQAAQQAGYERIGQYRNWTRKLE